MKASHLIHSAAVVLAACVLGCSTPSLVQGRYSYDRTTDFSEVKSFAFPEVDESVFSTPESAAHFRTTLLRALSAKGLTENPEDPDFIILAPSVETYVEEYVWAGDIQLPMAMLRVSFRPPTESKNIYEAAAHVYGEVDWPQEDKNAAIEEAVKTILANFPPGT